MMSSQKKKLSYIFGLGLLSLVVAWVVVSIRQDDSVISELPAHNIDRTLDDSTLTGIEKKTPATAHSNITNESMDGFDNTPPHEQDLNFAQYEALIEEVGKSPNDHEARKKLQEKIQADDQLRSALLEKHRKSKQLDE